MGRNYVDVFSGITIPQPPDISEDIAGTCGRELWNTDPLTISMGRFDVKKITPAVLEQKLDAIISAYQQGKTNPIPIFIIGPPGVGKTDIVNAVSKKYGMAVHTYIASTMDPTQVIGLPFRDNENKYITWYPDVDFVAPSDAARNHVYFFDELNMAPPSTQAAFYRLILEGRVGNINISNALRIGAGNRIGDFEYVQRMGLPMATRFQIYLLNPSMKEWLDWAIENDINPFIQQYVSLLIAKGEAKIGNDTDPRWFCINAETPSLARATPRSWARLSKLLDLGLDGKEDVYGSLGAIPGSVFLEWYNQVKPLVTKEKEYISGEIHKKRY